MTRRARTWLLILLVGTLVVGPLVTEVSARKRKPRFVALVDGKRFKSTKRAAILLYAPTGFSVNGQTRVKRGVSRFISVSCLGVDLMIDPMTNVVLPCLGIYQENIVRGGGGQRTWLSEGMELTIESIDGSRVTGSFRGIIQPDTSNPSEPAVAIEGGAFSEVLPSLGTSVASRSAR